MVYVNRYTSKKGPMIQLLGTQDELVSLGFAVDELTEHKPGRWNVRGHAEDMDAFAVDAEEANAREKERLASLHMRDLVDPEYDAELFFSSLANSEIGARVSRKTPGVRQVGVTWNNLVGMLMRDKWVGVNNKMSLSKIGIDEAADCLLHMEAMAALKQKGGKRGHNRRR